MKQDNQAEKYRILMVAPEPIFEPRGTPLSVVGRLKALSDMGHSVDLLTYSIGEDVDLPGVNFMRIPKLLGIQKIKIGPSLKKIPLDFFLMLKTFWRLGTQRYDFIHSHEEAGFWCMIAARMFRTPHLYDMHSSLPQQLTNFKFTSSKFWIGLFEWFEDRVLKSAKGVITICPDLQNYVKERLPEANSMLIENVVDYATIFGEEDRSDSIKNELKLADKTVLLYTGTFEPYQGLDLLIQSAAVVCEKDTNALFLMVGGHTEQVAFYQKMVDDAGLKDRFIFTGQVLPQEVGSYIRCADVLLSPRTGGTNTPLKIYAYLRSEVPMVATRLWTHTQILDDAVCVLADANPGAYAEGILALLSDDKKRKAIIQNALKLADEKYSYRVYKEKYTAMMTSLVKENA